MTVLIVFLVLLIVAALVSERSSRRRTDAVYRECFTADQLEELGRDPSTGRENR